MLAPRLSKNFALGIVLLLWLIYTAVYTLQSNEAFASLTNLIPGLLAVWVLTAAGFRLEDCFLKWGRLSKRGAVLLLVSLPFVPVILLTGRWTGWNWAGGLIYAPASAVAQELFFRCALLPVFIPIKKSKPVIGLVLHAALFSLWHVPKAALSAPVGGVIGVILVTFISGIVWGLQVYRDKTVVWMMAFHSLLLMLNSMFTWG